MILNSINPSGEASTVRCKASAVIPLIISLSKLKFHSFELVPEYRKFHSLRYVQVCVGLNHFARSFNQFAQSEGVLNPDSRRRLLETIIDASLQIGSTPLRTVMRAASYGGSC